MPAIHPPTQRLYFALVCGLTLYVAVGSFVTSLGLDLPAIVHRMFYRFSLAREGTLGAWWSGMLLLLGALHAFDGYFRYRPADARLARAWLAIGAVLVALSMDEIGSFHERMERWLQTGNWLLAVAPFLLLLLATVAWALLQLWNRPGQRTSSVLIVAGFVCFITVVAQEYVEHLVNWPARVRPLRVMIEEGTELLGMLLIIRAGLPNSVGLFADSRETAPVALRAAHAMPGPLLFFIVAAIPLMALLTADIFEDRRGRPSDWFAAALFFMAGLAILRDFLAGASLAMRRAVLALLCFVASLLAVWIAPDVVVRFASLALDGRSAALAALLVLASALLATRGKAFRGACCLLLTVAAIALIFAIQPPEALRTLLMTNLIALIAYCLAAPNVALDAARWLLGQGRKSMAPIPAPNNSMKMKKGSGEIPLDFRHLCI